MKLKPFILNTKFHREYLEGIPLTDLEGIKGFSANPEKTLISALNTWATSVVENDFFHADVHAGNLLVLKGKDTFLKNLKCCSD